MKRTIDIMTTAEVFADYLGLTPENAPWAFGDTACELCGGVGGWWTVAGDGAEQETQCPTCYHGRIQGLTVTSPLAPEPTPGWLEVLVRHKEFVRLEAQHYDGPFVAEYAYSPDIYATHPTHAVARALLAADNTLLATCMQCKDWSSYESQGS